MSKEIKNRKTKKLTYATQYFTSPKHNDVDDFLVLHSERKRIHVSVSDERNILNPNKNYRINVTIHELES